MAPGLPNSFLARRRPLLVSACVLTLLFYSIADFVAGSPGDATLLLAAFAASAAGTLILWPHASLKPRLDKFLPAAWDNRVGAFGLFALSAALVFGKITEDVVEHESPHLDRTVSLLVHRFDTPLLDTLMQGISLLGELSIVVCLALPVLAWCWKRRDGAAFAGLVGVIAADEILKTTLKNFFGRARPTLFEEIAPLHSFSFPSGHAMAAVAMYGMIAVVIGRLSPPLKPWVNWGVAILALLIGFSRVYLGAHWLTDVLGGYAAGAVILAAGVLWLEAHPSKRIEMA